MPNLEVLSLGCAVPRRDFTAVVHSVFPEAANLQPAKGDRLLTLVTAACADLPQGVRIATPPGFSFEENLGAGGEMTCIDGILRDEGGRLAVDLRQAKQWQCRLPFVDMAAQPVAEAWASAREALEERQTRCGAEIRIGRLLHPDLPGVPAAARRMGARARELVAATRSLEPAAGTAAGGLIGLGSGLTPSGDDFLIGFLTGLRCAEGNNEKRMAFLTALGKMVVRLSRRTNDISRTYLFHAARGQVSSKLAALAETIARGETSERLRLIVEDALRIGHSSGMETVTGLLMGLSAWGERAAPD